MLRDDPATLIAVEDASLRYGTGDPVLHGIDLSIAGGSFHFLIGASGSGKTSLLRMLSLAQPCSGGRVTLLGRDVSKLDRIGRAALRSRIGVVFQDFRLLDHLSAFDNVALPLRIAGAREDGIAGHVTGLLTWLGMGPQLEARPGQLSMGQRQLVAAARAVIAGPSLLLADEPTSSVDRERGERLMRLFNALNRSGTTVVLATHSDDLMRRRSHPVIEMIGGRAHQGRSMSRLAAA